MDADGSCALNRGVDFPTFAGDEGRSSAADKHQYGGAETSFGTCVVLASEIHDPSAEGRRLIVSLDVRGDGEDHSAAQCGRDLAVRGLD